MARLLGRLATASRAGQVISPTTVRPSYMEADTSIPTRRGRPHRAYDARGFWGADLVEPLSNRELQVLQLVAAGKSNQQIANELVVVVVDTVKKHVGHILGGDQPDPNGLRRCQPSGADYPTANTEPKW
jgi:ATP/maltotriose-dependent transcriptional regulator MalT